MHTISHINRASRFFLATILVLLAQAEAYGQFVVNGSASQDDCTCYTITPAANSQSGSVWNSNTIDLTNDFDFLFDVFLGCSDGGADGMAFVLQPINTSVGGIGSGMGFQGITPSFGITLDTYQNGVDSDPFADHIAININGVTDHTAPENLAGPVNISSSSTNVEDCNWHTLQLVWDAGTQLFEVYFDGVLRVSTTYDITANVFGGNPTVFWGFTASTGALNNQHQFCLNLEADFTTDIVGDNICPGTTVNFTSTSTSFGSITNYEWDFGDATSISGAFTNPSHTYNLAGTYDVQLVVTDNSGCTDTTVTQIIVNEPVVTASATPSSTCAGGLVQLNAGAVQAEPVSCMHYIGLFDTFGDGWNGGQLTVNVNTVAAQTYTLSGGSTGSDSIPVFDGDSIDLVWAPGGFNGEVSFTLSDADGTNLFSSGTGPATGVVFSTSVSCPAPNYTYAWSPAAGLSDAAIASPTVNVGATTTYTVTVTDEGGCTATDQVTVTVTGGNSAGNDSTISICNSAAPVNLFATLAGTPTAGGTWNDDDASGGLSGGMFDPSGVTTPGTYDFTYTITGVGGCPDATATVTVNVAAEPTANSTYNGDQCFTGHSFDFTNTGSTGGGITFEWAFASGTPATSTSEHPSGVTWGSSGTYQVTQILLNGSCTDTNVFNIEVYPDVSVTTSPTDPSCGLNNGQVVATPSGGTTAYTYNWSSGGSTATIASLGAGSYTLTLTDANGCTSTSSETLSASTGVSVSATPSDLDCNGDNSGSVSSTASSGSVPYTYSWSNGGSASSISSLAAGTYTVTVTDNAGCTAADTVVVAEPTALSVSATASDVNCNGAADGSVAASASGGTTAYTYNWSNGGSTATISSLSGGTFTITVTDANGCTATDSDVVSEPTALSISASGTDPTCNGGTDGSINSTPAGGMPSYTFAWSGGLSAVEDPGSVGAGTYTVTLTDGNGCTSTTSTTISEPSAISMTTGSEQPICGAFNGKAYVTASGGTGTLTYAWNDGGLQTTDTAFNVAAGTYTVTVTDNAGCSETASVSVTNIAAPTVSIAVDNHPFCADSCNGQATANVSGGTPPLTYLWSASALSQNTLVAINLCNGNHAFTVTDNNGCIGTASATLTDPATLTATISPTSNASSSGATDGSATVSAAGGTMPYTYQWDDGGSQTTATATGLGAGAYCVTVTDNNGCTAAACTTITEPNAMVIILAPDSVDCNGGSDGFIATTVSGGTPPYTYNWFDNATMLAIGQTNDTALNLAAGVYYVVVTDNNNASSQSIPVPVGQPTAVSASISASQDPLCVGASNGSATVSGSGGTGTLTYAWSGGQSTAAISGLTAGTYTYTVTDNNGCTASSSVVLSDPAAFAVVASSTPISCGVSPDGTATATPSGGAGTLTYNWSNGGSTATISNLFSGTYTVAVTDGNGCTATDNTTLTAPSGLSLSIAGYNVSCFGSTDGAAAASVTGGTTPYTYAWSNSASSDSISNLGAGTYTLTLTDNNGCSLQDNVTISAPAAVSVTISNNDPQCNGGADGDATAAPSGGTLPYTFGWSNGGSLLAISNLSAGTYTVTLTDNNGCSATASASLTNPPAIALTMSSSAVSCAGASNGSASVSAAAGSTPYTYLWNTGSTSNSLSSIAGNDYTVTVTDALGCTQVDSVTVFEPGALTISVAATDISCFGAADGSAVASIAGGVAPHTFNWSNGQVGTNATNLIAGTYTISLTDGNNCTATGTGTVSEPVVLAVNVLGISPTCNGYTNGSINTGVAGGTVPYTYAWNNGLLPVQNPSGLAAGTYTLTVTDMNGCSQTASTGLSDPVALTATTGIQEASCGTADGLAYVSVSLGATPYTYQWDDPLAQTTDTAFNVGAGVYNVTATDNNGCSIVTSASVTDQSAPTVSISLNSNPSCPNVCDGMATASASGGTPPLTYLWSVSAGSQTNLVATGLCDGTHQFTVTDANGCGATSNIVLTDPTAVGVTITGTTQASSAGALDATATAFAAGGTGLYTYTWNDPAGQTTATAANLAAGSYCVTASDANGCLDSVCVNVSEPLPLIVSVTPQGTSCTGVNNGFISSSVTGGTTPYTYSWYDNATGFSIGQSGVNAVMLLAGNYYLEVTDASGTTVTTFPVGVVDPPPLSVAITDSTDALCFGSADGSMTAAASGGTSPYTFAWSNGQSNLTANSLVAGTHSVTVTDNNGCTATTNGSISQPTQVVATTTATGQSCPGTCDGAITSSVSGGIPPYTYQWNDPGLSSTADISALCAGSYTLQVRDAHNCSVVVTDTVDSPVLITLATDSTQSQCGQANGTATVTPMSGTSPYSYVWDINAGLQSTATANTLVSGCYGVTVSDGAGCTASTTVCVTDSAGPILQTISTLEPSCFGFSDGNIQIGISSGTSPYTINWFDGQLSPLPLSGTSASNVPSDNYFITVNDATGCQASLVVDLGQPTALNGVTSTTDASCFGLADGTASVLVSGGTSPYTYVWNDALAQTTVIADSLAANTYNIAVTDAQGCSFTESVVVGQPGAMLASIDNITDELCGQGNGEICATTSNSVGAVNFVWSDPNAQVGACAQNLPAGTYSVTATDANGCTATTSGSFANIPSSVAGIAFVDNVSCFGLCDGEIGVSIAGTGTPPYSYLWPTGATTNQVSGLCAGTYTVTITDANGCTSTADTAVTQPTVLSTVAVGIDASCSGSNDGIAQAVPAGGTAPYFYQWSDPLMLNSQSIQGQAPGVYNVTVTDSKGCSVVESAAISEPVAMGISIGSQSDATCSQADGAACLSVSGGIVPYTYQWTDGQSTSCATGLLAGSYLTTVSDNNGCLQLFPVTIGNQTGPTINVINVADVACNGDSTGAATVGISGGTGSISQVDWFNAQGVPIGQSSPTAVNLPAGTYIVQAADQTGCAASTVITINQPAPIQTNPQVTNPVCTGENTGSVNVGIAGGTNPYQLTWNDPQGQTTAQATGLGAGTYLLTILDAVGCSGLVNVTLTDPPEAVISTSQTDVTCFGAGDGTAFAAANGGQAPYQYQWNDANNTLTPLVSNLTPGTYTVTTTDLAGCTETASVTITQPTVFSAAVSSFSDPDCNQDNSGWAEVTPSGGTQPYTYIWSNAHTAQLAPNLPGGQHSVSVTDANGCVANASITLTDPPELLVTIGNYTDLSCFGICDGFAAAQITGGSGGNTILWSGSTGFQTTATATSLCSGQHSVRVTDVNGCEAVAPVFIQEPTQQQIIVDSVYQSTCTFSNGGIDISALGGVGPYVYQWDDAQAQTTDFATGLPAGCYNITVGDANGCSIDTTICVTDVNAPVITLINSSDVTCAGSSDGFITFDVTGGVGPYQPFLWSDLQGNFYPQYDGQDFATGLDGPQTYVMTVIDALGCIGTGAGFVDQADSLIASITSNSQNLCFGDSTGSLSVSVVGGAGAYFYSWNSTPIQTTPTAVGLVNGIYTVNVVDTVGCQLSISDTITSPTPIQVGVFGSDPLCAGDSTGVINVNAAGGIPFYTIDWGPNLPSSNQIQGVPAGTYIATLTDQNNCTQADTLVLLDPPALQTLITNVEDAVCTEANGEATVIASANGNPPFFYQWSNGFVGSTATGLLPGTYTVETRDNNGCRRTDSLTIGDSPGPSSGLTFVEPLCNGDLTGSGTVIVAGGTTPYTYLWDDQFTQSTSTAIALSAGLYHVTVTDANQCTSVSAGVLNQPPPIIPAPFPADSTICHDQSITIFASAVGGTPNPSGPPYYNIQWAGPAAPLNPNTSGIVTPAAFTTYPYTILDGNGCEATGEINIDVLPPLSLNVAIPLAICEDDTAALGATASGGTGNYTFIWSNGFIDYTGSNVESNQTVDPSVTTVYSVILSDGCSPDSSDQTTLVVFPKPDVIIQTGIVEGCPPFETAFQGTTDVAQFPNATYAWDLDMDGLIDQTGPIGEWTFEATGEHSVALFVTSQDGCTAGDTAQNIVGVFPPPQPNFDYFRQGETVIHPNIQFSASAYTAAFDSVFWDWGDGTFGLGAEATHDFNLPGDFEVEVRFVNQFGCEDSITRTVRVLHEVKIWAPSAFTPNGDGLNDEFFPQGVGMDLGTLYMEIYDRWGELIWKGDGAWDGTDIRTGEVPKTDVYVYKIQVDDIRGVKVGPLRGRVTLLH